MSPVEWFHTSHRFLEWAFGPDKDLLALLAAFTIGDLLVTKVDDLYRQRASWGHAVYLLATKMLLWLLVLMAVRLNASLGIDPPILRDGVLWFLAATEGLNILTALGDLGLPIPPQLTHTLSDIMSEWLNRERAVPPPPPAPPTDRGDEGP